MNVEPWGTTGPGASTLVVPAIQYLLRAHRNAVVVDGAYGPATTAAVTAVQTAAGVPADGIVGPETWPHLVISTQSGSSGDAVRAVQQFGLVPSPGIPPLVVDGSYGPITAERVQFFQESWGLTQDGIAGRETWSFLSAIQPGPRPWPLVKVGASQATNWRVLAAQNLLRFRGATIAADGAFGPLSGEAVRTFQMTLRATFISTTLGQLDWPALIETVRLGDTATPSVPPRRCCRVPWPSTATSVRRPMLRPGSSRACSRHRPTASSGPRRGTRSHSGSSTDRRSGGIARLRDRAGLRWLHGPRYRRRRPRMGR